ncbi:MAG: guanylate kinase [Lachnospiraceae bacterium]|nr:guanylate kinase [Lachnospiraceae bacterium]
MRFIFYITGKSASGKDSIYRALLEDKALSLRPLLLHTTRPMREGETNGKEYHFVSEETYKALESRGEVIECRTYDTVHGPWRYFTVFSEVKADEDFYLGIGTLESYKGLRHHFGKERIIPIYIEVEDGKRLIRAIEREKKSGRPDYREMCRRYISDDEDFSDEKLTEAGIGESYRFENEDLSQCITDIRSMIIGYKG